MRRVISLFIFLVTSFFLPSVANAQEVLYSEQIIFFHSDIVLEQNTDIHIKEEIHYYFPTYRHGIIREIPTDYKVAGGFKRPTTLSINEIYYYQKNSQNTRGSDYERSYSDGYTVLQIGDPEVTIQGEYVFVISYTLKNAVNYFDDHDELYLNITGNGWNIPINQSSATITVPGKITERVCYTGASGSEESNCLFEEISPTETTVSVGSVLNAYEGYTVVLKMPKGTLEDTTQRQMLAMLLANIGILLPIPVFIILLNILNKKGKNKKITIIPHYEPKKGLFPLLSGYIYSKILNNKHITAEILDLAINGYIKIKQEGKKEYLLVRENENGNPNNDITKSLLDGLFKKQDSINTKKIPSDFYITVRNLNTKLNSLMYSDDYFDTSRKNLQTILLVTGIVGLFASFMTIAPLLYIAASGWTFGFFGSFGLVLLFSFLVDLRSVKGNEIYYELEGLKMYISTAEKNRIDFHNDPKKYAGVFEKLLPYAIIFGLEKKWAKQFEDIYKEPPSWYEGDMSTFNSYLLVNSISNINRNVQSKSVDPTTSRGFSSSHGGSGGSGFSGGSSGGGFGGGGGGSW